MFKHRSSFLALVFVMMLGLSACSSMPKSADEHSAYSDNDPIEPLNRAIFDVNDFLDRLLLRPLAELYRFVTPPELRDRVTNILANMAEPVIAANSLLQGEVTNASTSLGRLVVNSTVGLGGVFEVAEEAGLDKQSADFGQTLHVWGAGEGPYLMLPFFGPSNLRDTTGLIVDSLMSPWKYVVAYGDTVIEDSFQVSSMGATGLSRREANIEGLDAIREGSLDFYAQMRSVYRQHRAKQIGGPIVNQLPDFDEDYDAENSTPVIR